MSKTKKKRWIWVARQAASDWSGDIPFYLLSPTKPSYEEDELYGEVWFSHGGLDACAKFFEACTGIKLEPGAKPVKMEISLAEWSKK